MPEALPSSAATSPSASAPPAAGPAHARTALGNVAGTLGLAHLARERMADAARADQALYKEMLRLHMDPAAGAENAEVVLPLVAPMLAHRAEHRTAAEVRLFTEVAAKHMAGFEGYPVPLLHRLATVVGLVSAPAGDIVQQAKEPALDALWVISGSLYESTDVETAPQSDAVGELSESHEEYMKKRRSPNRRRGVAAHGPGAGLLLHALGTAPPPRAGVTLRAMPPEVSAGATPASAVAGQQRPLTPGSEQSTALAHIMTLSREAFLAAQAAFKKSQDSPENNVRELLLTPKRLRSESQLKDLQQHLRSIRFFAKINDHALVAELCRNLEYHLTPKDNYVFHQGDEGDLFYVVITGRCAVVDAASGRTLVEVPAGGEFGELALMKDVPRAASIVALEDCEFATLSKLAYQRTLKRMHAAALKVSTDFLASLECFRGYSRNALNKASYFFKTVEKTRQEVVLYRLADAAGGKIHFIQKGECRLIAPLNTGRASASGASEASPPATNPTGFPSTPDNDGQRAPTALRLGKPWTGVGQRKVGDARRTDPTGLKGRQSETNNGATNMRQILSSTTITTLSTPESFGAAHALGIANPLTDNLKVMCSTSCTFMCIEVRDLANLLGEAAMISLCKAEETKEEWYVSRIRRNTESRTEMKRQYDAVVSRLQVMSRLAFEPGANTAPPAQARAHAQLPPTPTGTISASTMHDLIYPQHTPAESAAVARPTTPFATTPASDGPMSVDAMLDAEVAALASVGPSPGYAALGNLLENRDRWTALQYARSSPTLEARHASESSAKPKSMAKESLTEKQLSAAPRRMPLASAASVRRDAMLYHNAGLPSRPHSLPLLEDSDGDSLPPRPPSLTSDAHVYLVTPMARRQGPVAGAQSTRHSASTPYREDLLAHAKARHTPATELAGASPLRESHSESLVLSATLGGTVRSASPSLAASPSTSSLGGTSYSTPGPKARPWRNNLSEDTQGKLRAAESEPARRSAGTGKKKKKKKAERGLISRVDPSVRQRIVEGRPTGMSSPDARGGAVSPSMYVLPAFDSRVQHGFVFAEY